MIVYTVLQTSRKGTIHVCKVYNKNSIQRTNQMHVVTHHYTRMVTVMYLILRVRFCTATYVTTRGACMLMLYGFTFPVCTVYIVLQQNE